MNIVSENDERSVRMMNVVSKGGDVRGAALSAKQNLVQMKAKRTEVQTLTGSSANSEKLREKKGKKNTDQPTARDVDILLQNCGLSVT